MRTVPLPRAASQQGLAVPALGLGTWHMGESQRARSTEVAAVRRAIELGYRLIDTAEMYGEGGAETVIGIALQDALKAGDVRRDELTIISKVYPHNASRRGAVAACERSLKRLQLDHVDIYLLHWRGQYPLAETVEAFETLQAQGRIKAWGVSNLDSDDMQELWEAPGGDACALNQVWYSAGERGVEYDLLPALTERKVPLVAYSPIDQATLAHNDVLEAQADRLGATAAQVALAWLLRHPNVIAIPKAVQAQHQADNLKAADLTLDAEALAAIDAAFPPPRRRTPLAMN